MTQNVCQGGSRTLRVAVRAQPPPWGHGGQPQAAGTQGWHIARLLHCETQRQLRANGSILAAEGLEKGREGAAPGHNPKFLLEERSWSLQSLHCERESGCLTDGNKLRVMNPGLN